MTRHHSLAALAIYLEGSGRARDGAIARTVREYDVILGRDWPIGAIAAGFVAGGAIESTDIGEQRCAATRRELAALLESPEGDPAPVWDRLIAGFEARCDVTAPEVKGRYAAIVATLRRERAVMGA